MNRVIHKHELVAIAADLFRMKGYAGTSIDDIARSCGLTKAIAPVASLTDALSALLVLGSFGASCVLVFGYPDAPFSQPRNVLAGHILSLAIAVGSAIAVMMMTRTVHPPAGSNPVIVFLSQPGWGFLVFPTALGALVIVMVALLYNNATRTARYPKYW